MEGLIRGWERSDRLAQPDTAEGGPAEQTVAAAPGSIPERRNPEPQRAGRTSGRSLLVTFCWAGIPAFEKVTRCKSGTVISHTRRNGYTPKTRRAWSAQRPPRPKKSPTTENQCGAKKLVGCGQPKELCQNPSSAQIKCNPEPPAQNSKATNSTPANVAHK
ncbi:hypothetical protein PspCFBP13508_01170 [Pseudomonas sp. CFBP13508]|nr:hypothetical protein PspCFBP13508_01170 [Pseudomonas sp. CFBP13508]